MIKLIIIGILAITTIGLLGSTIGLALTRDNGNKDTHTTTIPLCNDVDGYVNSFKSLESVTLQYIGYTEKDDTDLLADMMTGGEDFTSGQLEYGKQLKTLKGSMDAFKQLGKDCNIPGTVNNDIRKRSSLVEGYSTYSYEDFLESQGIY